MSESENQRKRDESVTVAQLRQIVDQFSDARNWERFHTPKSLSMSIAIEAAELMEHFQWLDNTPPSGPVDNDSPIAQEMADVLAYLLRLSSVLQIDLATALERKMIRNAQKYPIGEEFKP